MYRSDTESRLLTLLAHLLFGLKGDVKHYVRVEYEIDAFHYVHPGDLLGAYLLGETFLTSLVTLRDFSTEWKAKEARA